MKFGIQLFGVLKDRRSDTMDALRSLAGLIPRPEGNEKLLQTQELFVCCHGWSGSFAAGSPYAFFGRADRPDDRFADDFRRQGADQVPVGAGPFSPRDGHHDTRCPGFFKPYTSRN